MRLHQERKQADGSRFVGARLPTTLLAGILLEFLPVMLILAAGWLFTLGLEYYLDIGLYDETNYLYWGVSLPKHFPEAYRAPLYDSWYFLLSLLWPDRIRLYFMNYKLMSILPWAAVYAFLRINRVPRAPALACSLMLLVSAANFPVWPKVSHFAAIALLLGFSLISQLKATHAKLAAAVLIALLTCYVRPEFFLSYVLLLLCAVGWAAWHYRTNQSYPAIFPILLAAVGSIAFCCWMGAPTQGPRQMIAFGQHYSVNWVARNSANLNPGTDWQTIVRRDFGDVSTVGGAFLSNPAAFAMHVFTNLRKLGPAFLRLFGPAYPWNLRVEVIVVVGAGFCIVGRLLAAIKTSWRSAISVILNNGRQSRVNLTLILVFCLPPLVSCILIYPRDHYLLIVGVLFCAALLPILFGAADDRAGDLTATLFGLVFLLSIGPWVYMPAVTLQPNLATIRFLQSLAITSPVNLLEADGGYGIYVGDNYTRVVQFLKDTPFAEFLQKREINMILVTDSLRDDSRFREDAEWKVFLSDPTAYGFIILRVPRLDSRQVLVRKQLLQH